MPNDEACRQRRSSLKRQGMWNWLEPHKSLFITSYITCIHADKLKYMKSERLVECLGTCSAIEKMQAKEHPTNRNASFCTTAAGAIYHWRSERSTPTLRCSIMSCSKTTTDAVLLATNVRALVLALQGDIFSTGFLVRLLEKLNVLRVVGVLDHLGER